MVELDFSEISDSKVGYELRMPSAAFKDQYLHEITFGSFSEKYRHSYFDAETYKEVYDILEEGLKHYTVRVESLADGGKTPVSVKLVDILLFRDTLRESMSLIKRTYL